MSQRRQRTAGLAVALAMGLAVSAPGASFGQTKPPTAKGKLTIELNKVEPVDGACRIYMLLRNETGLAFDALVLELVSFDAQGVISQRVAVDLAPLRPDRTLVKLFDVPETPCDRVSQLLVNEAVQCTAAGAGAVEGCLDLMATSSKARVTFLE